ncbi:MAG: hypothetical protein GY941_16465 [Planctomycetes bacterium]|nr:hypothetical protein [Planctomycetota bacterium]
MYKQFVYNIARSLLPEACFLMRRIYKYRVEITHAKGIKGKLPLLLQSFWRSFIDRRMILFYPDEPKQFCVIYKILLFLGYRITTSSQKNCDLAIKYWHGFDGNPFYSEKSFSPLEAIGKKGVKVLNNRCNDISKNRINSVFEEVFGYSQSVDPYKYTGKCVMKSNWNALHQGKIIECPISKVDRNFVYVKLIRNETEDGFVEDMRVPVYGNKISLVYLKYRSVKNRFVDREHTNTNATITEVSEVLSEDEVSNVHRFCEGIGMEYGEMDVLRDRDDGRIYIVDANSAPSGPPSPISLDEADVAVVRLAKTFEETF